MRSRRSYDHRIKEQIIRARAPDLFPELEIPRSTAASWIRRGLAEVVSLDQDAGVCELRSRVARLEGRIAMLTAVLRLVLALLRVSGFKLEFSRVADAAGKRRLLDAIERARRCMPLSAALRVLRLSSARYHAWVRADDVCALDDRPSCPRSKPQRLTYGEVEAIGDMVQCTEHRHMSIRGLALYAQRVGNVCADKAGAVVAKYSFPAQFRVGCGGRKRRCGSHDRRDEGAGRRSPATRAQAASGGPGPSPSLGQSRRAQVRADGGFTHRMFSNGGGNLAVRSPSGR